MIGWWIIQSHQARGIYSQRSNNKLVVHWMSVFSTVEPRFTNIFQLTCVDNPALRSLPRREN